MKTISILGATGSIGQNTLDLVSRERDKFQVKGLTGSKNIKLLAQNAIKFGVDVVTELCDQLLNNGTPGLHFFTMNRSAASNLIWKNLGLDERQTA